MVRKPRDTQSSSDQQIQERVNRVMDNWQSYPTFASLMDALLKANHNMFTTELAERYLEAIGPVPKPSTLMKTLQEVRGGRWAPTYSVVENLVRHNLLNLDPQKLHSDSGHAAAGPHRIAMFSSAGFIEVTPQSIRVWNRDVLASFAHATQDRPMNERPTWKDLMRKLLAFHTQGGRLTWDDIASNARNMAGDSTLLPDARLRSLLCSKHIPTRQERLALAAALHLDDEQAAFIEHGIESGQISVHKHAETSPFSKRLNKILIVLRANGITTTQLALQTRCPAHGLGIDQSVISTWRSGNARPSLANLRALVTGLRRCEREGGGRLISDADIHSLIDASDFTSEQLMRTSHEVVADISADTSIKPLLAALRNSIDVSVTLDDIPVFAKGERLTGRMISVWESETMARYPTGPQVRALLRAYNKVIRNNNGTILGDDEIDRVVEVAERERFRWKSIPASERILAEQTKRHHLPPSPSFDDGPAR